MTKKILAIDDTQDNLTSIKAILNDAFPDIEVLTAQSGKEGLAIAKAHDPDVILLDIIMPGMDGYAVCKSLKEDLFLRDIPVVFFTALKECRENRLQALEVGAEAFLSKPVDIIELTAQITAMLKIRESSLSKRDQQERLVSMVKERTTELELSQTAMLNLLEDLRNENEHRRKTEEELKKNNEFLNSVFRTTQDGFFVTDRNGRFTEVNSAYCGMTGYMKEELLNMALIDLSDSEHEKTINRIQRVILKKSETFQVTQKRKDGSALEVELAMSYLSHGTGNIICFCRDLTERKSTEKQLQLLQEELNQAQKMESIGRLAGGVAHDFNNMLGVILGQAELALEDFESTHPAASRLKEIQNAANRSAGLTRQLLAFARKQTIQPTILELNETVEGMLKMLSRLIGEGITLTWIPGEGLSKVNMDPSQIDQILANLCINARDAMNGSGCLTISTRNEYFDGSAVPELQTRIDGTFVLIEVRDNGCGMDERTITKIFEPFFTTKDIGKGTGLGLSTVYGIVKQNNGFITVESELGRGSVFKVWLPAHEGEKDENNKKNLHEYPEKGTECILLVEDEPILLEMTMEILASLGYRVLAADEPDAAITLAQKHKDEIDLLVTDVILPGMSGPELARYLQCQNQNLPCLFVSGYTADQIAKEGVLEKNVRFIQKPFSKIALARAVRETIHIQEAVRT